MSEVIGKTWSLCPVCLHKLPAERIVEGDNVYLSKECEKHGKFKTLIWRGADHYKKLLKFEPGRKGAKVRQTASKGGCPWDCGLCPGHKQDTCLAVMEITNRCNLNCRACFASSGGGYIYEPGIKTIKEMYGMLLKGSKPVCVQISGGEPTVREDLPEIVSLGKRMGIDYIELNTNGIRLAEDPEYLRLLKQAGLDALYLSFDGLSPSVYRKISGANLLSSKKRAVENCAEAGIGVVLVPKIIKDINLDQVGRIIAFAKKWIPTVKGVHFQPLSYFGRYPDEPRDDDRVTIPDLLHAIEVQTDGEVKADNFIPTSCPDVHCDARCLSILLEDGKLLSLTSLSQSPGPSCTDIPKTIRESVASLWKLNPPQRGAPRTAPCKCKAGSWMEVVERATENYLTISTMAFQDVWNIDLERLEKCCIHEVTPDLRLIPFCAFNVTSISGESPYRHQVLSKYAK
ncbi:MAG: radical SAM (seleno)protein TrsS [Candidatus Hadarchaeum sp.]|uniref:radical SAM (seleno)protein TrsS n=1 Tax=Candidatus Hadarchaeum sp. TaxID=2883567 RepID=UPI003D0CDF33